jgi:hypothetical protein
MSGDDRYPEVRPVRHVVHAAARARAFLLGPLPGALEPPLRGRHPARYHWSITAMRETIGRLCRAGGWDRADGFAVISEAVWRVTIVDAALVRYHPETYGRALARQDAGQRRIVEDTFAGLRFVRNRMGYDAHPADLVQPLDSGAGIAAWTWKPVPEPALGALAPRGRTWELTRYRAYQAQLASRTVGEIFTQAVAFLDMADDVVLSRTYP